MSPQLSEQPDVAPAEFRVERELVHEVGPRRTALISIPEYWEAMASPSARSRISTSRRCRAS